jgi:TusA-related sulfurtransferase
MTHDPRIIPLDIQGQICPSCLLLTLKLLNDHGAELRAGAAVLEVLTDDRQATATIPDAVAKMGFRCEVTRDAGLYRLRIDAR